MLGDLHSRSEATDVSRSEVVLVTIGANDFSDVAGSVVGRTCGGDDLACARSRLVRLDHHLDDIFARIHRLRSGRPTTVLVTGYWNVFEDGDVAEADYSRAGEAESERLTRAVNAVVEVATDRAGLTYVDLYGHFKGADGSHNPTALLADDGDHPDAAGHLVIAGVLVGAGLTLPGMSAH